MEAVILSAAKNLRPTHERFFAALRMTAWGADECQKPPGEGRGLPPPWKLKLN